MRKYLRSHLEDRTQAIFRYYGISPWEIETLYSTLGRAFEVDDQEVLADDPQYVSMVEISFPLPYGEPFFETFTMENWFKIKGILKDMKHRRGKKGVKTYLRFAGFSNTQTTLVFPLLSRGDRQFEMGLEKLEYLVDIVSIQLKTVPDNAQEIWYSYNDAGFKWSPDLAKANNANYVFRNDEWKAAK